MQWINEILLELRKNEETVGVSLNHYDVAYWFLHENEWCNTYIGNCDSDWMNIDLPKLNHPERCFELRNDCYRFIDLDDKLVSCRKIRSQLIKNYVK